MSQEHFVGAAGANATVAQIIRLDHGWIVQWGNTTYACESPHRLGEVIFDLAAKAVANGGWTALESAMNSPTVAVDHTDVNPDVRVQADPAPRKVDNRWMQAANLEKTITGYLVGTIAENELAGIRKRFFPDIPWEDVNDELERQKQEMGLMDDDDIIADEIDRQIEQQEALDRARMEEAF